MKEIMMNKLYIYGGIAIGSIVGAYIPVVLFGSSELDGISLLAGFLGSIVGLILGYKASQNWGE